MARTGDSGVTKILSPKDHRETVLIKCDWTGVCDPLAPVCTVEWVDGAPDAAAAEMMFGDPFVSGLYTCQHVRNGVPGTAYRITFEVAAGSERLVESATFRVKPLSPAVEH